MSFVPCYILRRRHHCPSYGVSRIVLFGLPDRAFAHTSARARWSAQVIDDARTRSRRLQYALNFSELRPHTPKAHLRSLYNKRAFYKGGEGGCDCECSHAEFCRRWCRWQCEELIRRLVTDHSTGLTSSLHQKKPSERQRGDFDNWRRVYIVVEHLETNGVPFRHHSWWCGVAERCEVPWR